MINGKSIKIYFQNHFSKQLFLFRENHQFTPFHPHSTPHTSFLGGATYYYLSEHKSEPLKTIFLQFYVYFKRFFILFSNNILFSRFYPISTLCRPFFKGWGSKLTPGIERALNFTTRKEVFIHFLRFLRLPHMSFQNFPLGH